MTGPSVTGDVAKRLAEVERGLSVHALHFAAHVALPVAVDPQLLHLVRVNFFLDPPEELPHQVEAKLLLSPVFRETGDGLYEMDGALRNELLSILQHRYGTARIRQVATLLNQYIERSGAWSDQHELERAQQLTALNFLDPLRASAWLEDAAKAGGTEELRPEWFVAMRGRLERTQAGTQTPEQRLREARAQLGAEAADRERNLRSIWALGELGRLPGTDQSTIVGTLMHYLRRFAALPSTLLESDGVELDLPELAERAPDIQAAVTVLCAAVARSVAGSVRPPSRMLAGIDLRRANLAAADLSAFDLSEAFLQGADLRNATLVRTNLTRADLRNADLRDADAVSADFTSARLDGANLADASLAGASFVGATTDLATRFPAELRLGELGLANPAADSINLSADDIHNVAFARPSAGTSGYNEDEVDAFLDLVEAKFRDPAAHSLTAHQVHNVAFSKPPPKKRGYNEDEVDAFLDLIEARMKSYEPPAAPSQPVEPPPPARETPQTATAEILRVRRELLPKTTRFTRGYDQTEVDAFLDLVEEKFRDPSAHGLTARHVRDVAFSRSPIGGRGYVEDDVDAFLELVETELSRYEQLAQPGAAGSPSEGSAPGGILRMAVEDLRRLRASLSKARLPGHGYRTEEVDAFLDRLEAQLGGQGGVRLSPADVKNASFFLALPDSRGYVVGDVRRLLDAVATELTRREYWSGTGRAQPSDPTDGA